MKKFWTHFRLLQGARCKLFTQKVWKHLRWPQGARLVYGRFCESTWGGGGVKIYPATGTVCTGARVGDVVLTEQPYVLLPMWRGCQHQGSCALMRNSLCFLMLIKMWNMKKRKWKSLNEKFSNNSLAAWKKYFCWCMGASVKNVWWCYSLWRGDGLVTPADTNISASMCFLQ